MILIDSIVIMIKTLPVHELKHVYMTQKRKESKHYFISQHFTIMQYSLVTLIKS